MMKIFYFLQDQILKRLCRTAIPVVVGGSLIYHLPKDLLCDQPIFGLANKWAFTTNSTWDKDGEKFFTWSGPAISWFWFGRKFVENL